MRDTKKNRERMIRYLMKHQHVTLDPLPEDIDPEDSFDDPEDIAMAKRGGVWDWFCARVRVTYDGITAEDYLGGCCYESEADFKRGPYYSDMVRTCCTEIVDRLFQSRDSLRMLAAAARCK